MIFFKPQSFRSSPESCVCVGLIKMYVGSREKNMLLLFAIEGKKSSGMKLANLVTQFKIEPTADSQV